MIIKKYLLRNFIKKIVWFFFTLKVYILKAYTKEDFFKSVLKSEKPGIWYFFNLKNWTRFIFKIMKFRLEIKEKLYSRIKLYIIFS